MSQDVSLFGDVKAGMALIAGLALVFFPTAAKTNADARHEQKLAERAERGSDSYFEEERALKTYMPFQSVTAYRLLGLLMILLGGGSLASRFF